MKQRYFITFAYDGTAYHGWQVQPNANTVQEELQKALSTILRQEVSVVGAGRTDTGVHARKMVAHFDIEGPLDGEQLTYKLNRLLPRDISVFQVEPVEEDMHARFSALARTYHYYIHTRKDPFRDKYSCEIHYDLDYELMNEACKLLMEYEDFGAFCKSGSDVATTLCRITEAYWSKDGNTTYHFRITANRFLRNMVRAIVGTLVEVGRHRITLEEFCQVIEGGRRTDAGESMPAHALFLEDVRY